MIFGKFVADFRYIRLGVFRIILKFIFIGDIFAPSEIFNRVGEPVFFIIFQSRLKSARKFVAYRFLPFKLRLLPLIVRYFLNIFFRFCYKLLRVSSVRSSDDYGFKIPNGFLEFTLIVQIHSLAVELGDFIGSDL